MIAIASTRFAIEDVRRARGAAIETHPDGRAAGEALAGDAAARRAHAIGRLPHVPRIGHPGAVPDVPAIVVSGPTRRLTSIVGHRVREGRVTVLGITWGGRSFGALGRG